MIKKQRRYKKYTCNNNNNNKQTKKVNTFYLFTKSQFYLELGKKGKGEVEIGKRKIFPSIGFPKKKSILFRDLSTWDTVVA